MYSKKELFKFYWGNHPFVRTNETKTYSQKHHEYNAISI